MTELMRYYHFDRYRDGKLKAEGAVTQAANEAEALARVQSWYSIYDSFKLREITGSGPDGGGEHG